MSKSIAIVDYGMGNLDSVARAIEECGGSAYRAVEPRDLDDATGIILPGVGAFSDAIDALRSLGFAEALEQQVLRQGIPMLGICLGMQMLAARSYENGVTEGLGWFDAEVRLIEPTDPFERVPHVGWNNVEFATESALIDGIESGRDFYFVHSYHVVCSDTANVVALTPYADGIVSIIGKGNVWGTQFHPEKSQSAGFQLLTNFLNISG